MLEKITIMIMHSKIYNNTLDALAKNVKLSDFVKKCKDEEFVIEIVKYLFVGVLTTIICIGTLWIFYDLIKIEQNIANIISNICAIIAAYILNRGYVFKSEEKNIIKEVSKFAFSRFVTTIIDIIMFYFFTTILGLNVMAIKVFDTIVVVILNYFFSKLLVFKKKSNKKAT